MNILITSAGRRVSLVRAFKNEIKKYLPDGKIFTADLNPEMSSACRISDGYFQVVMVTHPDYCKDLVEICLANNVKVVIPTIDTELIPLAENIEIFKKSGISLVISSLEIVRICRDKRQLFRYFDLIGFPRTQEIDINNPTFPVFMKPVDGSSSIGTGIITNRCELTENLSNNINLLYLKYLGPEEYIEYTVDLYFDKSHFLKCAVPRKRIEVRSGEVSKAVTVKDDLLDIVCSVFNYCDGFTGCITLQLFRHRKSKEIFGIEINPRFGGGFPLSYMAGANYPDYIIREYLFDQSIEYNDNWNANLLMLRYDDEVIIHDFKS